MSFWKRLFRPRTTAKRPTFPGQGLLLTPPDGRSSWSLACVLAKKPGQQPHLEEAARQIRQYLETDRQKTPKDIDEMSQLVSWAIGVMNPADGGTGASAGRVHQVVGDIDDLEMALGEAQRTELVDHAELERLRGVLQRHAD